MPFDSQLRTQVLLWCDRHCCLCKKPCGVNIEVDHLIPEAAGGSNDIENAMPLCFDCHSEIHRYNDEHPRGTKYKIDELQARRKQVYEEFTRHLVPPIHYEVTQALPDGGVRQFPDIGFVLAHLGDSLPVHVRVKLGVVLRNGDMAVLEGHYAGRRLWSLNPRFTIFGHFVVPAELRATCDELRLRVEVSIIDQYKREHLNLPVEFVYVSESSSWYLEP